MLYRTGARLEQLTFAALWAAPAILSRTQRRTCDLFGCGAVFVHLDPTVEAEALGCPLTWPEGEPYLAGAHPDIAERLLAVADLDAEAHLRKGRLPTALEAARRLVLESEPSHLVLASLPGPLSLLCDLAGRDQVEGAARQDPDAAAEALYATADLLLPVVRAYLESGVHAIVISELPEVEWPAGIQPGPVVAESLRAVVNVAAHWRVPVLLRGRGLSAPTGVLPVQPWAGTPPVGDDPVAIALSPGASPAEWDAVASALSGRTALITTDAEIPQAGASAWLRRSARGEDGHVQHRD